MLDLDFLLTLFHSQVTESCKMLNKSRNLTTYLVIVRDVEVDYLSSLESLFLSRKELSNKS